MTRATRRTATIRCVGDEVQVHLRVSEGVIENIGFEGAGCAISTASASLMTEALKGLSREQAKSLFDQVHELLTTDGGAPIDKLGETDGAFGREGVSDANQVRDPGLAYSACRTQGRRRHSEHGIVEGRAMSKLTDWLDQVQSGDPVEPERVRENIVAALREIYDPEIPVNIYDLGLIYKVDVDAAGVAEVEMTLTTPGCPVAQTFPGTVEAAVREVDGVSAAHVELVWDPPWTMDNLSEAAKLHLGLL